MTSERKFRDEKHIKRNNNPDIRRSDGRYLKWSWRYKCFQQKTLNGAWMNVTLDHARTWAAAGMPIGCSGGDA